MKKIIMFCFIVLTTTAATSQKDFIKDLFKKKGSLSQSQIGKGLKQALEIGIEKQVSKLTAVDGFLKNEIVKIIFPEELQRIDKTLRSVGLGSLADEGIKVLNRAAEDAVKEATPIFIDAVKGISFNDAKNILLGNEDAATQYLKSRTSEALYTKFKPVIQQSFTKVGADAIWGNLIKKYNALPLTRNVNPDLTEYTTEQALKGVFTMIAIEEKEIRAKSSSRTTDLLRKVFALQD